MKEIRNKIKKLNKKEKYSSFKYSLTITYSNQLSVDSNSWLMFGGIQIKKISLKYILAKTMFLSLMI